MQKLRRHLGEEQLPANVRQFSKSGFGRPSGLARAAEDGGRAVLAVEEFEQLRALDAPAEKRKAST